MKINTKTLLGVAVVGAIGYFLWNKSKNKGVKLNPEVVPDAGGDAKESDPINTQYELLQAFKAPNAEAIRDIDFPKGAKFIKRSDKNGTVFNSKSAIIVAAVTPPIGLSIPNQYVIPESLLKKISSQPQQPKVDKGYKTIDNTGKVTVFDERGVPIAKPPVITNLPNNTSVISTTQTLSVTQIERIKKFQDELIAKTISGEIKSQADADRFLASSGLTKAMVDNYNQNYAK
jgi:hypothetical protein